MEGSVPFSRRGYIFWQCARAGLVYVGCDVGGCSYPATIAGLDVGGECAGRIGARPLLCLAQAARRRGFPAPSRSSGRIQSTPAPRCLMDCKRLVLTRTQTSIASRQNQQSHSIVVSLLSSPSSHHCVINTLSYFHSAPAFACPRKPTSNYTGRDASCPAIRRSRPR